MWSFENDLGEGGRIQILNLDKIDLQSGTQEERMDWVGLLFSPIKPFVAHPERIIAVATGLLVAFGVMGYAKGRWPWPCLWATGLWTAFAIWEWLVLVRTPEANIRVDLLLIYPILLIVTLWALWSAFWPQRQT